MVKKGNKLTSDGCNPNLKNFIDEGRILLPNKYLFNHIIIPALDEGSRYGKSSELYSHDNMIVNGSQGYTI